MSEIDLKQTILNLLGKLDPTNDEHWTALGLPRLDTLNAMLQKEIPAGSEITRTMVRDAAPDFDRTAAKAKAEGATVSPIVIVSPAPSAIEMLAASLPDPDADKLDDGDVGKSEIQEDSTTAPHDTEGPDADSLYSRRSALEAELLSVQSMREQLILREKDLARQIDDITAEIEFSNPPEHPMEAIQAYIASQNALRQAKAARTKELVALGVFPGEISRPMAKIDAALSRSRKRGTDRPTYPGGVNK